MDNRELCLKLWKQFKAGEVTLEQMREKLSELEVPEVRSIKRVFKGTQVNRGCPEEPF
jgi:hypothetical protein